MSVIITLQLYKRGKDTAIFQGNPDCWTIPEDFSTEGTYISLKESLNKEFLL